MASLPCPAHPSTGRRTRCALVVVGVLMASCQPAVPPAGDSPTRLRVFRMPTPSFGPLHIAQEEGFFANEGLSVEFLGMKRTADALPAVMQGDLDVTGDFIGVGYLNAMARGGRVRFVADKGYVPPTGCDSNTYVASRTLVERAGPGKAAQLKGVRFGGNPRAASGYFFDRLLARGGLTIDDVEIVDVPLPVMEHAIGRSVDLALLMEPAATRTVQSGRAVVWSSTQEFVPNFQLAHILYGPNLLDRNREAGVRFMTAYLRAVRQFNQGKTERNLDILVKHTGQDRDLLKRVCWPSFRPDGGFNLQSVSEFQDWAVSRGLLDTPVAMDQVWDRSFAERAVRALDNATR